MVRSELNLKRIFVSNLSKELNEEGIINIFSKAGKVQHILLFKNNRDNANKWMSEGECIIMFETEEEAREAISIFDEKHMFGLRLKVHIDDCSPHKDLFKYKLKNNLDQNASVNEV
jgi:RNA recognition motif-containing protein